MFNQYQIRIEQVRIGRYEKKQQEKGLVVADNVKLVLEFDSTGAIAGVNNFGSTLKKETKEASSAFDGLQSKLTGVGAAIAAYFTVGAIKDFFGAIITESMDAELQLNQLNGALQRAGTYTAESSKAMVDYATALMNMSTIDDDVILGQLAIARNFTKTDEQARKLITAAADLSAAMDIDLGTAVEQLGRSLDGTAGRLNETVPALRGVSEEALKAGAAIDVVGEAFAGAAANKIKTFEGALQQAGNAFGNFKAAMGDAITQNPVFIAAINEISRLFVNLTGRISDNKDGLISWVNDGILGLISGIRGALPYINEFMSFLKSLAAIVTILKEGFMGFLDSLVLVGSGMGMLIEKFTGGEKSAYLFQATLDDMAKRADIMAEALAKIGTDVFSEGDLKAIDEAFARIAAAAKNNPVKIDANLNLGDIKGDLSKITGQIEVDTKVGEKKKEDDKDAPYVPQPDVIKYDTTELARVAAYIDLMTAPIREIAQIGASMFKKMGDGLKELSPTFLRVFNGIYGSLETIATIGYDIGDEIYLGVNRSIKEIRSAWNESGGGFNPIVSSVLSMGAALKGIDWTSLAWKVSDSFLKIYEQTKEFAINLASGALMSGVAVSGTAVASTVGNISKGEAGAFPAIVETLGAMGTAFDKALGTGSMIGDILKSFLNALSDPENLKGLINGFINAIPRIIDSIINAIPTLMDGIIRALPILLDGIIALIPVLFDEIAKGIGPILIIIADKLPDIIIAIAKNLGPIIEAIADAMPTIITKLVGAIPRVVSALARAWFNMNWVLLTKGIPAIIEGILTGISKMISNIGSGLKSGVSTKSIGDKLSAGSKNLVSGKAASIDMTQVKTKLMNAATSIHKYLSVDVPKKLLEGVTKLGDFFFKTIPAKLWEGIQELVTWYLNLGIKIWNQGILPLINWFISLPNLIWTQGFLPLVNWFAGVFQAIWDQGIMPLVNWFAGVFQSIWDQGILPLVNWFAGVFQSIWDQGIMPLVTFFSKAAQRIWNEGILPLVNWFINLGPNIWNNGVIPLVNWFINLGANIWNQGVMPLVNWFANLGSLIWNNGVLPLANFFGNLGGELWNLIQNSFDLSGGGGGLLGGKIIPGVLATGGIVPKGYPNDTYPALLTSGETVVPADSAANLFKAIDSLSAGKGNTNNETNALLRQLIGLIAGQETIVNVQLDRNVLAKAILTLNQDNRRIA